MASVSLRRKITKGRVVRAPDGICTKPRSIGDREYECQRRKWPNAAHLARQRGLRVGFRCQRFDVLITAADLFVEGLDGSDQGS
jgi:hypothetical protein